MGKLIKFELKKIMNRKKFLYIILAMIFFHLALHGSYIFSNNNAYFATRDSDNYIGKEAKEKEKNIALYYEGKLTNEKIQSIFEELSFSDKQIMGNIELNTKVKNHFLYNIMYHFLNNTSYTLNGFNSRFSDDIIDSFYIGYSEPWSKMIYYMVYDFLLLGFLIIIVISPVFSNEYTNKMDTLLLTSCNGHIELVIAKLICSYIICFFMVAMVLLLNIGLTSVLFGTNGLDCSVQLTNPYMFENVQSILSLRYVCIFSIFLLIIGAIVICSFTFLCSSIIKSSYGSLISAILIYVFPIIFPVIGFSKNLINLFPVNFLQIYSVVEINSVSKGYVFNILIVSLLSLVCCITFATKKYISRQVKY